MPGLLRMTWFHPLVQHDSLAPLDKSGLGRNLLAALLLRSLPCYATLVINSFVTVGCNNDIGVFGLPVFTPSVPNVVDVFDFA